MRPFTFRLDALLRLRASLERLQSRDLGLADHAVREHQDAADATTSHLEVVHQQLEDGGEGVHTAGTLQMRRISLDATRAQVDAAAEALAAAEAQRAIELARFTEARIARRALEKLRERNVIDWQAAAAREEREEIDELARRRASERTQQ